MNQKTEVMTMESTSMQLARQEIDMQIATAKKYPRDEEGSISKMIRLATSNPLIAKACFYFRPVGKKDGIQQFAHDGGIRLAEICKTSWGNLRIMKEVIGVKDGQIGVKWGIHDLESNVMESGEVWRSFFGAEKMIPVITAASMKFAERDAVFSVIPKSYRDEVLRQCRLSIVGEGEDRSALVDALMASYAEMGITPELLETAIDRRKYPKGSEDEIVFILGLQNALKDGLVSKDEVFGSDKTPSKPAVDMPKMKEGAPAQAAAGKAAAPAAKAPITTAAQTVKTPPAGSIVEDLFLADIRSVAFTVGIANDADILKGVNAEFNTAYKSLQDIPQGDRAAAVHIYVDMQKAQ